MALARLAAPLKTLIPWQPSTRALGMAAYHTTSPGDFQVPVNAFVTDALTSAGLEATTELATLSQQKIINMGLLKSCDLDDVGLSVGAKTAIARALVHRKNAVTQKAVKLQREASLTKCKKQRAL